MKWAIGVASALFLLAQDRPTSIVAAMVDVDWATVLRSWRIKGAMACPEPCLWVENAFPVGMLEVARREMQTGILEFQPLLAPFAKKSSSHTGSGDRTDSTLQFAEAHVFNFVPPLDVWILARPEAAPLGVSYLSELDRLAWRDPLIDLLLHPVESAMLCEGAGLSLRACAGTWGNFYPRHGFVARDSEVMAAYLQALRAGRIASAPALHVALGFYPFEPRAGHYVQMLAPVRRSAIKIGDPKIAAVEAGAGAKDGAYRFVHFGIFEACRGCIPTRLVEARRP
jgi:hypothetical protein